MRIDVIIKSIRKELGISQEMLARDLNVSFATLNRWENGHTTPSLLAMTRIKEYAEQNHVADEVCTALSLFRT
jgi:DNA-binding transcriptional regulator YiaG